MKYEFEGTVEFRENENTIAVPFNVWEVCEKVGDAPVRVCFDDVCFICDLVPKGQGYYDIPVSHDTLAKVELGKKYLISIEIVGNVVSMGGSPYSTEHPIRKIDSVDLVTQPWDGLCGQACIAMIAGTTLDEACDIMKCREWQANMSKMIATLEYLGIRHSDKIVYTLGKSVELPHCCIIMEKMGRYSHYLVQFDGGYYEPNQGVLKEFDQTKMVGYLEIIAP
ncbi:MAG: DUF1905 domain-containing protein [Lachnospiraceae bacterium]|nr:DUF1905 domain-containing protein [Lachnospiraceae bacterium]